jgi:hypothetical protein
MGRYINKTSTGQELGWRKAQPLIDDGAKVIPPPTTWQPGLVCVVDNGVFQAAGYAFDEREMQVFLKPDGRDKVWLEYAHAETLAE